MVGGAAAVLSRRRAGALAALLAGLLAWEALAGRLPDVGDSWDVALTALVLIPATFATVWLALPLASMRRILTAAALTGAVAVASHLAGLDAVFNVTKLLALTLSGFWFLTLFEALSWVVLVAAIIPWVDVASVYRGPTKVVVEQEPGLFETIAISFRLPGEDDGALLGPPDVLFFALFLAATERFGLRVWVTWLSMTAALGLTLVATYAFDLGGLPALPAIALGFLLPNLPTLVRRRRASRRSAREAAPPS
ncbi:MAG: hypothetical protein ACRC50_02770 [Gaiella sp.]